MTRTYALKRLLEHGAMTRPEIITCTGWKFWQVDRAINQLSNQQLIKRHPKPLGRGWGYAFEAVSPHNQGA